MGLINEIIKWINTIGGSLVVAGVIGCFAAYYFLKVKKIAAKEEHVNTSNFRRTDAVDYVPVKDVLHKGGLDTEGIIAINDTLFVGGLSVRGFDYPSASNRERVDAQVNSQAFFNVVEDAITFRQSVKGIDLSANVEEYEKIVKDLAARQMVLDADYQSTLAAAEAAAKEDPDSFSFYEDHVKELQRTISSLNHQIDECNAIIGYMKAMMKDSGKQGGGQKSSQILFSYQFDPSQYSQELTKEQIYVKAQEALAAKARTYADALAFCHFRATRLTCRELILLIRKHNCPISGEDSRLEELLDSSYSSLFVSSDSLVEAQKDLIGEEEYEARLARYEAEVEEYLRLQREQMEADAQELEDSSRQKAYEEIHGEGALS
jgi:hypothetical protein